MRLAAIPLLLSAGLHVVGWLAVGFASESLFLLLPAGLYTMLSVGLWRSMRWVAWVTLVCMLGGIGGTVIEFFGALMAPASVLVGIILADLVTAGLLVRGLLFGRDRQVSD